MTAAAEIAAEAPRDMTGGYAKIYRRLYKNPVFKDVIEASIWIKMVLTAQTEEHSLPTKFGEISLQRGELVIAEQRLASEFRVERTQVRSLLKRLVKAAMITRDATGKCHRAGTIVRILKFDTYQWLTGDDEQAHERGNCRKTAIKLPENNTKTYKEDREPYGSLVAGGADDAMPTGRKPDPAAERQWLGTDDALPGQMPLPGMVELPVATPVPAAAEPVAAREPVTVPEPVEQLEQPVPEILPPEILPPDPTVMQAPAPRSEPAVAALAGELVPMRPRTKATGDPEFDEFYAAYPVHEARKAALTAYRRARRDGATHAEIMAGVERYKLAKRGTLPQHLKHPATWLNAACWTDEYPTVSALPNGYHHDNPRAFAERRYAANGKPPTGANALALIRAELAARRA